MLKNYLIIIVACLISLLIPVNSWAISNNFEKEINTVQTINCNFESSGFFTNELPYQLVSNVNSEPKNPYLWIGSIILPGLGQIMMGDFGRGIKFSLITIGSILLFIYTFTQSLSHTYDDCDLTSGVCHNSGGGSTYAFFSYISVFVFFINYIWNIIDAASMSHDIIRENEQQQNDQFRKTEILNRIKIGRKGIFLEVYNF